MKSNWLGGARSPDLADPLGAGRARVLIVPLGSTEQHGPHLPVSTDSIIAEAWADAFAESIETPALVAPMLPYGAAGEHQSFAGTLSIGTEALVTVVIELCRSAAHRFDRIVVLSGHGGNADALHTAAHRLVAEAHRIDVVLPVLPGADAHGGRTETSLMLHLAPELVRLDLAERGATEPVAELLPRLRAGGVAAVSSNGVLGDPTGASAEEGRSILAALVRHARTATGL